MAEDSSSLAERVRRLRDKVQRREKSTRANRQARARRIEREEPEGVTERAAVTQNRLAEAGKETKNLAADAKTLVSTELGVSEAEAGGFIAEAADVLNSAGEGLEGLDFDGDGDTDLLTAVDQPVADDSGGGMDPTEPVMDFAGEMTEPEMGDFDAMADEPVVKF